MAFSIYKSTDANAPQLAGLSGSLVQLLDCILVNGYGNHSGAGWTKEFSSGPALAVYRAPVGNRLYLRIDDSAAFHPFGASGGQNALAIGYETMSSVFSGTNAFPRAGSPFSYSGAYIRKSNNSGPDTRPWKCFVDNRTMYLFLLNGDVAGRYQCFAFGEFTSVNSNDNFNTLISAKHLPTPSTNDFNVVYAGSPTGLGPASLAARAGSGLGGPVGLNHGINGSLAVGGPTHIGNGALEFPNGADGGIYLSNIVLFDQPNTEIRGYLRGILNWCHLPAPVADGDYFQGTGADSTKSFEIIKAEVAGNGLYVVETSDTLNPS